jgi:hypothetical protein
MRTRWMATVAVAVIGLTACGGSSKAEDAAKGSKTTDAGGAAASVLTTRAAAVAVSEASEVAATDAVAAVDTTVAPALTEPADDTVAVDDTFPTLDTIAPVDTSFTGEGSTEFCALMKKYNDESPTDAFNSNDPADLEKTWKQISETMAEIDTKAPPEIADDVSLVADAFQRLAQLMQDNDYDMLKVGQAMADDPELQSLVGGDGAELDAATARLDAYGVNVCGVAP